MTSMTDPTTQARALGLRIKAPFEQGVLAKIDECLPITLDGEQTTIWREAHF